MTLLELAHQAHIELFCDRDLHLALQRTEGTKTSMGDAVGLVHDRWIQQLVSTSPVLCSPTFLSWPVVQNHVRLHLFFCALLQRTHGEFDDPVPAAE